MHSPSLVAPKNKIDNNKITTIMIKSLFTNSDYNKGIQSSKIYKKHKFLEKIQVKNIKPVLKFLLKKAWNFYQPSFQISRYIHSYSALMLPKLMLIAFTCFVVQSWEWSLSICTYSWLLLESLQMQVRTLLSIRDLLGPNHIDYFLDGGGLLGNYPKLFVNTKTLRKKLDILLFLGHRSLSKNIK